MKIPAIKKLVENYSVQELMTAEEDLVEEREPSVEVEGADEGEKLTHVFAAIFIHEKMEKEGKDFKSSLREYTSKVRTSIS
ncbi:MAG: hypothetical protein WBB45_18900 [Cyclobacteriaceae bacterium]